MIKGMEQVPNDPETEGTRVPVEVQVESRTTWS
jgi:hypothetical protein